MPAAALAVFRLIAITFALGVGAVGLAVALVTSVPATELAGHNRDAAASTNKTALLSSLNQSAHSLRPRLVGSPPWMCVHHGHE